LVTAASTLTPATLSRVFTRYMTLSSPVPVYIY
jgi:hypothetical protein